MANNIAFFCLLVFATVSVDAARGAYLGKSLGKLSEYHHGVSGEVFAVDGRTLHIKDFTYDGEGPAAYFWAGSTRSVGTQGFRIRDEDGRPSVIRRYKKEGITLTLPEGKTLRDIKWFSVWCEEFEVNFGDVKIPRNFDFPRPQKLAPLQGVHGISSDNVVVVDAQTLLIPNLSYDGEAPDAKFWTGPGPKPSPQGIRIPDENGKETPLRRYDKKTVVLTFPSDLTVFDLGHFGIWCEAFTVDFGHIQIPNGLNVPPSLKMLGISPQKRAPLAYPIISDPPPPLVVQTSQPSLVGGQLEATTYRPSHIPTLLVRQQQQQEQSPLLHSQEHFVVQRRINKPSVVEPNGLEHTNFRDYRLLNNAIQSSHSFEITQPPFVQYHQHYQPTQPHQHQIIIQRPVQNPFRVETDRVDVNGYQSQLRQPVPYTPFNFVPQQTQEQIAYNNQVIQNRRILEEQLSRQHNRFSLPQNSNYHFG